MSVVPNLDSCRICFNDNCVSGNTFEDNVDLMRLFEFCSGMKIGIGGTRRLCKRCIKKLKTYEKFKKKCTESELYWESLLNSESVNEELKCTGDNSNVIEDGDILEVSYDNDIPINIKNVSKEHESSRCLEIRSDTSDVKESVDTKESGDKTHTCGLCNTSCVDLPELNSHLNNHWITNSLNCQSCSYIGRDFADTIVHRYEHGSNKVFSCFICNIRNGSPYKLQFHFRQIHLNKPGGWCNICGKTFEVFKSWRRHMLFHDREKKLLECEYCGKRYLYKYQIEEHILHHLKKRQFVCETCGKGFSKKFNLKSHQRNIHTSSVPVKCNHCDKIYKNEENLIVHMKEVNREKPYVCELCSKRFSLPSYLKNHLFYHTGQKPFACDICGLKYKSKGSLKYHRMKHLGIFKHNCAKCSRCFTTAVEYRRHLTVHTGVRKFQCERCDKSFNERPRYDAHVAKHGRVNVKKES